MAVDNVPSDQYSPYLTSLTLSDHKKYLQKLKLSDGDQLPDPYTLKCWINTSKHIPNITWVDISTCLLHTPSEYTKEVLKAYKSMDAYNFFFCGHVQDIFTRMHNEFCFLKSKVSALNAYSQNT